MTDNYYRYLSVSTNTYIPFHTFVFILTMKTIPNFIFRFPYLAFRIMTLPIEEISPETKFYPYLFQISEQHLLLLQATQTNLNQFAQVAITQAVLNVSPPQPQVPQSPKNNKKDKKDASQELLPIEDLFTVEEQNLLNEIFQLLSIPSIPLREQQIPLVQFNFYMKILGVIPQTMSTSLLYVNLRLITATTYKNRNKYQLDTAPLDSYDISQQQWIQQVQLSPPQRELLKRYNDFKEQQQHMLHQKEKYEQSKKGLFERFISSTATKLFTNAVDDADEKKKALQTPIYAGLTFFAFSEFLCMF
jgi:hypothetical protein